MGGAYSLDASTGPARMKLTGPFQVLITGDTTRVVAAPQSDTGLGYLLGRYTAGDETALENLTPWGLTIAELRLMREATEDDVEAALAGSYVEEDLAGVDRAALLEFWNRMLDRFVGVRDD